MLRTLLSRQLAQCPALATTVQGSGCGAASWAARFHASALAAAGIQVKIPPLGESISDGTVAAVLKQAGDRVEEDEPILQIETDKVTVDVRAPAAGVIEAILVKPDENVEVGHVVASIGEGGGGTTTQPAAAAAEAPSARSAPPPKQQQEQPPPRKQQAQPAQTPQQQQQQRPGTPAAAPDAAASHRAPSIRFPPRRTADGRMISALPPSEAQQMLAQMLEDGGGGGEEAHPAAAADYRHMIAVPIVGGSMPVLRGPPVPPAAPGPPRRTLTDREMELIMLGGAEP